MMQRYGFLSLAACTLAVLASSAHATPYAANVRNTGGNNWEFVLNQAADNVTVLRNGANPVNLGAIAAGRHTFDMTGFTSFEIKVTDSSPAGWSSITDPSNPFDDFTIPSGVIINQDPSDLKYFGTVYVGSANPAATKSGRTMGDGIYALTADMKGVNADTFAAVADANDATQAKGSAFFSVAGSVNSSPWRLSFDDSNNLIVADWSDPAGGVKYLNKSLTAGGKILGGVDFNGTPVEEGVGTGTGPSGGVYSEESDEFGRIPLHGSSGGKVYATGSVGNNLTIYVMDEDLDVDLAVPANDTNHIWRHDVGAATNYQALAPTLIVNSKAIPTNTDGSVNLIGDFTPGVATGMLRSERYNHWYVNQPRDAGTTSAGVAIIDADLDGSDSAAPTLLWSSIQATIDNNLDLDATAAMPDADPNTDIFRRVRELSISPDGKWLALHKNQGDLAIPGSGAGAVYLLPLDANGIPVLNVVGGQITNIINIETLGDNGAHNSGAQIEWDAAGNLYVANSAVSTTSTDPLLNGQLVQVFSPGGDWVASTKSDGTFTLAPNVVAGVAGDYNGNGVVDAADYVVWKNGGPLQNEVAGVTPGSVTPEDYDAWRARVGNTSGSGSGSVPEPGTLLLAGLGLIIGYARRQRRA